MSDFLLVPVIVSLTQSTVTYSTTLIPPYQLKYNYTVADSRIESWSYRDFVETCYLRQNLSRVIVMRGAQKRLLLAILTYKDRQKRFQLQSYCNGLIKMEILTRPDPV